jgi:hypothetical protein
MADRSTRSGTHDSAPKACWARMHVEGHAMMQLGRRASLVVVLLLLASVGTASAECAWVLWVGDGPAR